MTTAATGFVLGVIVMSLGMALAAGFAWLQRRERRGLIAEKEKLLDEVWELKATASALNKAEAANEAKSRFLAMVSHEVRTPLAGILGMAELLTATELNGEQSAYVDAIHRSAESLYSLINEILDFSKIEAGKLDLNETIFDLPALVEGLAELLAPRAQGKGIEIATSIDKRVPRFVRGDPDRLRQVLMNLAGNAIKSTEQGGVGLVLDAPRSQHIHFSVRDTGPGVPTDHWETIFQEFEQADGSLSRKHEGTGLGLTISRSLVQLMGGALRLERTGPEGSVFGFEIELPGAEPAPETARNVTSLKGRTALIVAATPFGGPFLGERLVELGATVSRAEGEAEALVSLRHRAPDLVIIDCALGEKTTQRLALASREKGAGRNLVLFSPFERRAFGDALVKDFDGWLVKPVRVKSLHSRLTGEDAEGVAREPEPDLSSNGQPLLGRRILLAEDNEINALLVERQLTRLGAQLVRARDGAEAVALACENMGKLDTVITDIRMPGVDGLTAARQIRAAERKSGAERVRIIALTANVSEEDREAALRAGMDGFLAKPVDLKEMLKLVTPS